MVEMSSSGSRNQEMNLYVAKSNLSGHFFRFVQYTEDGYGKYEDELSKVDIETGTLPTIFEERDLARINNGTTASFKNHERKDIEILPFVFTIG